MRNYNVHLIELREKKNLSLKDAAKAIGIARFRLYLLENGYFRPSKKTLEKIESFYEEKISFEGPDAYPAPTKDKVITAEKHSVKTKRIVFGSLSAFFLTATIVGTILLNAATSNIAVSYGPTYNETKKVVNETGKLGHDLVTSLPYRYIDYKNAPDTATILFYQTDSIMYFNECTYSTTYLLEDYGTCRYHYRFGSNLGINSKVCEFHFGSWTDSIYFACNFVYEGGNIKEFYNFRNTTYSDVEITDEFVIESVNQCLDDAERYFSYLLTESLGHKVSFYHDFLADREHGRVVNYGLQVTSLFLIFPSIIGFFICLNIFLRSLLKNIKPRLVTTEADNMKTNAEPLPKDIRLKVGIPDIFVIVIAKVLQVGSVLTLLLVLLSKVGLPLPAFMANENVPKVLSITLLAGIFLEHFVLIGRIKKPETLFKTIVFNIIIFSFIATVETALIALTNVWGYDFAGLIYKYVPSNAFQVVAIHYLIFLFLFFQPPFIGNKKKYVRIIWHSLSLIPLGLLITTYFLSNSYALTYGVEENIFINFWFPNGFLPLSVVSVSFMYITFGLRLYYERKYGKVNAQTFFYGDRYNLYENLICAILIIIVGSLDFIFAHNQYAYYLGLGSNYWIFAMIPFVLLCKYSPNNQQVFMFTREKD